jgi:CDGSH-type Zn-finger protein
MDKPKATAFKPKVMEVEAGEYWWCACGLSNNQPFCDGSHKGTKFAPQKFIVDEKKTLAFCQCRASKSQPFCDGSHSAEKGE